MSGFAGQWIQKSQEGYEEFMKLLGVPQQYIEANKNAPVSLEIEEIGDKFSIKTTIGTQSWTDEFEIGKPAMITGPGQKKLETTVSRDGNKLIGDYATPQATITACRALDGDLLYDSLSVANVEFKRTFQRKQ